jgi:tetratricopeptide (TPR) repeat protein
VRQALEIHQRLLGPGHPVTLGTMNRLSDLLTRQGSDTNDEIYSLHTDVLERSRGLLGDDHVEVASARNNLAMFMAMRQGRFQAARRHEVEALRIWRLNHEGGHPHIVIGLTNLGYIASELGDLDEAQGYFGEAIEHGLHLDARPVTTHARLSLARALHHAGRLDQALPLWNIAASAGERTIDSGSRWAIALSLDRVCLYLHLGRAEEAASLLADLGHRLSAPDSTNLVNIQGHLYHQHLLALLSVMQGRWTEAQPLLVASLEELRKVRAWASVRRHLLGATESICREAGREALADSYRDALVELEASISQAL